MIIEPIMFFGLAATILILALCLITVVFYLSRIIKAQHGNLNVKDEAFQKNINLLDEAGIKAKNIEVFQNVSKDIEINTTEEIKNFKESMQKLTTLSQEEVKKKIDTDYEVLKKEIADYKKEELQKIDSGIYELLEKISKIVLGKALSLADHEGLIEKSLEKAKKEGVFR